MKHTEQEKDILLQRCRAALDTIFSDQRVSFASKYYELNGSKDTIGNLRAELSQYRMEIKKP